ncbi:hypothetical protein M2352_004450 [Azospirillum fermentarium]|uniref:hypothetical protein n=1 Tax=Azospirillum fermentarium TaxID=1233114 RepID=UPI002227F6EF|nr:hypothetical protein [Azospirillum fermentarium]MCW2248790.1 hypothetical protein [Azospirillum fermentarium]
MSMTSSLSTSSFSLGQSYVARRFDPSMSRAPTAEEISQRKQEAAKQAAGLAEANDPAKIAAYKSVKAHTVVRMNGEIVAAAYRDGTADYHRNAAFIGLDAATYANQLAGPQGRDYMVNAIMKKLGNRAVEERYGETGWAPNRGAIDKEANASKA